jgi:hypothetical protein
MRFKKFKEYNFLANQTRHEMNIFDVDDTLIVTKSYIKVTDNKTGKTIKLTPQEFNEYEKQSHHSLDFSDFTDPEILKAGHIIDWVFKILKDTLKKSKAVGIITARNDRDLIRDFLLHNGVDINPDFIFAVSDPKEFDVAKPIAERKKEAFIKLIDLGFTNFKFFDDDKANLNLAKSLEKELDGVKIKTTHIKQKWIPRI